MKLAVAGIGKAFLTTEWGHTRLRFWVIAVLVLALLGAFATGLVYGITQVVRSAGAASCRTFASQSGYPAHYKIQHWMDGGICYVHLPNGHTLPQKMVVAYLKAAK